eukprot:GHVS01021816.1.p1 GENE.GHVS01021816.1~~GHVS01021816.1.p1  ORF type:complete len:155 (-),score=38.81 GHVS01021816.1:314-754(-)
MVGSALSSFDNLIVGLQYNPVVDGELNGRIMHLFGVTPVRRHRRMCAPPACSGRQRTYVRRHRWQTQTTGGGAGSSSGGVIGSSTPAAAAQQPGAVYSGSGGGGVGLCGSAASSSSLFGRPSGSLFGQPAARTAPTGMFGAAAPSC